MEKLTSAYKLTTAREFTSLAIQNNLFVNHSDPKETSKDICDFFKYLLENLDSKNLEAND